MLVREHKTTDFGTPVSVELTPNDVATAIFAYCVAKGIHINGPRTVSMDGKLLRRAIIFVDPSGFVVRNGVRYPKHAPNAEDQRAGPAPG